MKPSRVLRVYCAVSFVTGTLVAIPIGLLVNSGELDSNAGAALTLCWNVLLLMILPLVLDWSERKYFKARFIELEELSEANPELKAALDEQCKKLALPGLRLATIDSSTSEPFTYGLWRQNPRLIVPKSWLNTVDRAQIVPSIEVELNKFARRDVTIVFLIFAALQVLMQQAITWLI